ncbi:MAG TPA: S-methyl-5-thioribose-1-phosphate isomerase [Bacteroidota bacterium]|nr:S-methyl-5-thioribose-1-phosphate isomerase [Bacteroidota bacterium]
MVAEPIRPLEWLDGKIRYLDQRKLPTSEIYVETDNPDQVVEAIKTLAIRGAPLIGIAAAYGVALAIYHVRNADAGTVRSAFEKSSIKLGTSRPTAVNLFWALQRMRKVFEEHADQSLVELKKRLLEEARQIHREDEAMCRRIGELGAEILPNAASVLTHCNTGYLATGGKGTAQGILSTAWERHKLKHVYIDETRPLLQGARLTAWELIKLGIPATLLTDNTAAFVMQRGAVNAVVVGADRIAANGDVANKVGTYGLAVLAKHHGIPFYVAAPISTVDPETVSGAGIPIEQRSADEVTIIGGHRVAVNDVDVYSPAFDVTPNELITAIVTDRGVLRAPFSSAIKQLFSTL